jgi:uncharacterized protein with PIN domain
MTEKNDYIIVDKCSNCGASLEFMKKETKKHIENTLFTNSTVANFFIECPNCGKDHLWRFEVIKNDP